MEWMIALCTLAFLAGIASGLLIARSAVRHHETINSEFLIPNSEFHRKVNVCGADWYLMS